MSVLGDGNGECRKMGEFSFKGLRGGGGGGGGEEGHRGT